ncbi:MAG: hypothetical protein AAF609_10810 [Cyanobacteria bacterium P01_C01_bin.120]
MRNLLITENLLEEELNLLPVNGVQRDFVDSNLTNWEAPTAMV